MLPTETPTLPNPTILCSLKPQRGRLGNLNSVMSPGHVSSVTRALISAHNMSMENWFLGECAWCWEFSLSMLSVCDEWQSVQVHVTQPDSRWTEAT